MAPVADISDQDTSSLIFYYNQLPLHDIDNLIKNLSKIWDIKNEKM